jgi:hypothetical protein
MIHYVLHIKEVMKTIPNVTEDLLFLSKFYKTY